MPFGRRSGRTTTSSTFKNYQIRIGAPMSTISRYPVSPDHHLVRRFLIETHRRRCHWEVPWEFRVTFFCKHCRSYLTTAHPIQLMMMSKRDHFALLSLHLKIP